MSMAAHMREELVTDALTMAVKARKPSKVRFRRRTEVVGTVFDRGAAVRLIGAALAEQHEEWAEQRGCMGAFTPQSRRR